MIGLFARFVGLWFVAGGLAALVIDAAKTIAASALTMTSLGMTLATLAPAALASMQAFVDRHLGHWLWDPVIQWILLLPTWLVLSLLGFLLTYFGRRRRPRVAYA